MFKKQPTLKRLVLPVPTRATRADVWYPEENRKAIPEVPDDMLATLLRRVDLKERT